MLAWAFQEAESCCHRQQMWSWVVCWFQLVLFCTSQNSRDHHSALWINGHFLRGWKENVSVLITIFFAGRRGTSILKYCHRWWSLSKQQYRPVFFNSSCLLLFSLKETTQIEDPRVQWRREQEHMLKDYLILAQEAIAAQKEIYQVKQQRLELAQQEYRQLHDVWEHKLGSQTSCEYYQVIFSVRSH